MKNYCLLVVEGPHDQAAITRILQLSGFTKFNGESSQLDSFWEGFVPKYPKGRNFYTRMDMPSIVTSQTHSIAIYAGEGSKLVQNIVAIVNNHMQYAKDIQAFGLIIDADKKKKEKALIASIVSILRPGKTNTISIAQDEWISEQTINVINDIAQLHNFLKDLLILD